MNEDSYHVFPDGRMTSKDTAFYIGLSDGTLANWRTLGKGPKFTKIGGRIYYYKSEIDCWLQEKGIFQTTAQARVAQKLIKSQTDMHTHSLL